MSFFRNFPGTTYNFSAAGTKTDVVDIFKYVAPDQIKLDDSIAYTYYDISNGERPDVVSQLLYQDPDYYWTFFVINSTLKSGLVTWPLSDSELDKFMRHELDVYGVIAFTNTPGSYTSTTNGIAYVDYNNTVSGIDFESNSNVRLIRINANGSLGARAPILKYNPAANQLWIKKGGVGAITLTTQLDIQDVPYTLPPRVKILHSDGAGAEYEPILNSLGQIIDFRQINPGDNYTAPPMIELDETPTITAKASIDFTGTSVTIMNPGLGYKRSPLIFINKVLALTSTVTLDSNGAISSITGVSPAAPPNSGVTPYTIEIIQMTSPSMVGKYQVILIDEDFINSFYDYSGTPTPFTFDCINPNFSLDANNFTLAEKSNSDWKKGMLEWYSTVHPGSYIDLKTEHGSDPDSTLLLAAIMNRIRIYLNSTNGQIEFKWALGRNAPESFTSQDGEIVTAQDVYSGKVLGITTPNSYSDILYKENIDKSRIKVVNPEYIKDFAGQFRAVLNT